MYLLTCLLLVIYVNRSFISCRNNNTGYECENENACENVTGVVVDSLSVGRDAVSSNFEVNDENFAGNSSDVAVRTMWDNALGIWRKIWNSDHIVKAELFGNDLNDVSVRLGFESDTPRSRDKEVARTFGIRRRMQLLLFLPISFKLGVILTLLLVLTTMSLKTLIIGFIILLLILSHTSHAKLWGSKMAELSSSDSHKSVHIHVHTMPEEHPHYVEPGWQAQIPHTTLYHL